MREVRIEGAGLAGLVLHRELSRRGIPSRLVDRAGFPRPKVCGGILQWDSWQYLSSLFDIPQNVRRIDAIRHFWRGRQIARHRLPQPMVYAPRVWLDNVLYAQREAPSEIPGETIRVNARGAFHPEGEWLGFEASAAPVEDLEMHYGRGICAGISPTLGPDSHLAFIVKRGRFRDAETLRDYLFSELKLRVESPLKGTARIRYGVTDDPLAIGDAKMTTFPFLGLGMKHAILSARLLAERISDNETASYDAAHKKAFRRIRRFSRWAGSLYDSPFQFLLKPLAADPALFRCAYRWLHG